MHVSEYPHDRVHIALFGMYMVHTSWSKCNAEINDTQCTTFDHGGTSTF
jgi:hypothetical protein